MDKKMVEYWVNKSGLSVRAIENQLNMPDGTLAKARKGVRTLPTIYEDRFIEFCNNPIKTKRKKTGCEVKIKLLEKENNRLNLLVEKLTKELELALSNSTTQKTDDIKSSKDYFSQPPSTEGIGVSQPLSLQQKMVLVQKYKALTESFCTDEEWDNWRATVNRDDRLDQKYKQMAFSR